MRKAMHIITITLVGLVVSLFTINITLAEEAAPSDRVASDIPAVTMVESPPLPPAGPHPLATMTKDEVINAIKELNNKIQELKELREAEKVHNEALKQLEKSRALFAETIRERHAADLRKSISGVEMTLNLNNPPRVAYIKDGTRNLFFLKFNLVPSAGSIVTVEQKKAALTTPKGMSLSSFFAAVANDANNQPNNNGIQVVIGPVDRSDYDDALSRLYAPAYLLKPELFKPLWLNEGTTMAAIQTENPGAIIPMTMKEGTWKSEVVDAANHSLGAGLVDSINRGRASGVVSDAITIARDNVKVAKCVTTRVELLGNRKDFSDVAKNAVAAYNDKQFPKSEDNCVRIHIVKRGDTLGKIAAKYCGDPNAYKTIMKANQLTSDAIFPGDKLTIPCGSSGFGE